MSKPAAPCSVCRPRFSAAFRAALLAVNGWRTDEALPADAAPATGKKNGHAPKASVTHIH